MSDKKVIDSTKIEDLLPEFQRAASMGDVLSMRKMGDIYYLGLAGEKNYARAVFWYEKATDNNDTVSMNRLANIYLEGKPSKKDVDKAIELLEKAASLENSAAMNNLGLIYRDDMYGKQDLNKAEKWFKKAIDRNNDYALFNLGVLYFDIDEIDRALNLIEQSIEKGNAKAMLFLGSAYYSGIKVEQDKKRAFHYFGLAAEKDDIEGLDSVAYMLEHGDGVEENKARAAFFRKRARFLKSK